MELVAPRNIILRALSAAAAIAPEKAPRPILSHALMVADAKGHVTITAQQEAPLTYTTSVSAMVKRPGKVCFPARYLASVVKSLPDGDVTLAVAKNGTLAVTCGKRGVKGVGTMDPDEYPSVLSAEGTPVKVPVSALKTLIKRVFHAASMNEGAMPHLCSMLLKAERGSLLAVAMDGATVAKASVKVDELAPWPAYDGVCILPRATVEMLIKQLPEVLPVFVTVDDRKHVATLTWDVDGAKEVYTSKLIDAKYPNWSQAFRDDDVQTETRVSREALLSAAKFALLTADAVQLIIADAGVSIVTESDDKGKSSESIDATTVARNDGAVPPDVYGANGRKLVNVLESLETDEVVIGLDHSESPMVMWGAGDESAVTVNAAMRV
jgi:DNA polymerase-3 subunit beta